MALLKLGGLITKISGKLGGNILGTSANGSYIRSNSYSQQPNTPLQDLQRVKIGIITQFWRSMSATEKASYAAQTVNYPYVNRVGDTVEYTPYQLFCYLNLNRQVYGAAPLATAPTYAAVTSPDGLSFAATNGNCSLITDNGVIGTTVSVYVAPFHKTNTPPPENQFIFAKSFLLSATTQNNDITAEVAALLQPAVAGDWVTWGFRCYDTASGNNNGFEYAQTFLVGISP